MKERALKLATCLEEMGRVKDMGRPPVNDTEREAAALIRDMQSRLEELNQKVEELEKENASLKEDANRWREILTNDSFAVCDENGDEYFKSKLEYVVDNELQFGKQ